MEKFTAKVVINGELKGYIDSCFLYKGKLVQEVNVGIGEPTIKYHCSDEGDYDEKLVFKSYEKKMKPYFNSSLEGIKEIKELLKKDQYLTKENETKYLTFMFSLGENPNGYVILDHYKEIEKDILNGNRTVQIDKCHVGLYIKDKLPIEIFNKIKPFGTYWSKQDVDDFNEDVDDFGCSEIDKGYYYTDKIFDILDSYKINTIILL